MSKFTANTQYNDFRGTAAADRHDLIRLEALLPSNYVLDDSEIIIGFSFGYNDGPGQIVTHDVCLHLGVRDGDNITPTRDVDISLNGKKIDDVLAHLKRFKMVVTIGGLEYIEP